MNTAASSRPSTHSGRYHCQHSQQPQLDPGHHRVIALVSHPFSLQAEWHNSPSQFTLAPSGSLPDSQAGAAPDTAGQVLLSSPCRPANSPAPASLPGPRPPLGDPLRLPAAPSSVGLVPLGSPHPTLPVLPSCPLVSIEAWSRHPCGKASLHCRAPHPSRPRGVSCQPSLCALRRW